VSAGHAPASLEVEYFDGVEARARAARLTLQARRLVIHSEGERREVPWADVSWPERQRHGPRIAHIASGGAIQCTDAAAWDAFTRAAGVRDSWIVRAQQNWRATTAAVAALLLLTATAYRWGLPWAARGALALMPATVDRTFGEAALHSIDGRWLMPSQRTLAEQQRLRSAFADAVARTHPPAQRPAYELRFHKSRIGPNAFALPGGVIVLTDELLELAGGRDDVVLGVLAHELGHVQQRHGMRLLVQFTLLGTATSIAIGDFSSVLTGVPALLGQMAYSRDFEREADAESVLVLRAAGLSPDVMIVFFERIAAWRGSAEGRRTGADFDPGIAWSSHPADEERIRFFRQAARR
jgi:Zn-dependent protease with chaperone function